MSHRLQQKVQRMLAGYCDVEQCEVYARLILSIYQMVRVDPADLEVIGVKEFPAQKRKLQPTALSQEQLKKSIIVQHLETINRDDSRQVRHLVDLLWSALHEAQDAASPEQLQDDDDSLQSHSSSQSATRSGSDDSTDETYESAFPSIGTAASAQATETSTATESVGSSARSWSQIASNEKQATGCSRRDSTRDKAAATTNKRERSKKTTAADSSRPSYQSKSRDSRVGRTNTRKHADRTAAAVTASMKKISVEELFAAIKKAEKQQPAKPRAVDLAPTSCEELAEVGGERAEESLLSEERASTVWGGVSNSVIFFPQSTTAAAAITTSKAGGQDERAGEGVAQVDLSSILKNVFDDEDLDVGGLEQDFDHLFDPPPPPQLVAVQPFVIPPPPPPPPVVTTTAWSTALEEEDELPRLNHRKLDRPWKRFSSGIQSPELSGVEELSDDETKAGREEAGRLWEAPWSPPPPPPLLETLFGGASLFSSDAKSRQSQVWPTITRPTPSTKPGASLVSSVEPTWSHLSMDGSRANSSIWSWAQGSGHATNDAHFGCAGSSAPRPDPMWSCLADYWACTMGTPPPVMRRLIPSENSAFKDTIPHAQALAAAADQNPNVSEARTVQVRTFKANPGESAASPIDVLIPLSPTSHFKPIDDLTEKPTSLPPAELHVADLYGDVRSASCDTGRASCYLPYSLEPDSDGSEDWAPRFRVRRGSQYEKSLQTEQGSAAASHGGPSASVSLSGDSNDAETDEEAEARLRDIESALDAIISSSCTDTSLSSSLSLSPSPPPQVCRLDPTDLQYVKNAGFNIAAIYPRQLHSEPLRSFWEHCCASGRCLKSECVHCCRLVASVPLPTTEKIC